MSPNNILNMAMLKGLDFVAITDHNSTKQLFTVHEIEKAYDFILIPGIEVTVQEDFDVLCYFKTYKDAHKLDKIIEQNLHTSWGPFTSEDQMITDIFDITKDTFDKPLLGPTIPYIDLYNHVKKIGGIVVLAHIDRKNKSALKAFNLNDIPFDGIEVQHYFYKNYLQDHIELKQYIALASSDSHTLLTLLEKGELNSLELSEKSINAFFNYFEGGE